MSDVTFDGSYLESDELPKRGYWIKTNTSECPGCGRVSIHRERQHTEKPKDASERYTYTQAWCGGCYD